MKVSRVDFQLARNSNEATLGYATVTFDGHFVLRELRLIRKGRDGTICVSMPCRKMVSKCDRCFHKCAYQDSYCPRCGVQLQKRYPDYNFRGKAKLFSDIAYSKDRAFREHLEDAMYEAYQQALKQVDLPPGGESYEDSGDYQDEIEN